MAALDWIDTKGVAPSCGFDEDAIEAELLAEGGLPPQFDTEKLLHLSDISHVV